MPYRITNWRHTIVLQRVETLWDIHVVKLAGITKSIWVCYYLYCEICKNQVHYKLDYVWKFLFHLFITFENCTMLLSWKILHFWNTMTWLRWVKLYCKYIVFSPQLLNTYFFSRKKFFYGLLWKFRFCGENRFRWLFAKIFFSNFGNFPNNWPIWANFFFRIIVIYCLRIRLC